MAFSDRKPTLFNFYGDNLHIIAYPISETGYSWAFVLFECQNAVFILILPDRITRREAESRETWRVMDAASQDTVRRGPFSSLPFGAGDLVHNAKKITKVRISTLTFCGQNSTSRSTAYTTAQN